MDTNQLKNKLTRFEALPPEGAWDKIVEGLESTQTTGERLYHYSELPHLSTWQRIEKELDAPGQPAKVIPFTTRFKRPIRYVAAASCIGIILIASTLLMKRTEAGAIQAGSNTTVPVTPTQNQKPAETITTISNESKNIISNASSLSIHEASPFFGTVKAKPLNKTLPFVETRSNLPSFALEESFIPAHAETKEIADLSSADHFMVYNDGDGHAMKLPKKLFDLVLCKDGDGSCKERIHQLQEQLSSPAITADFSGVLEMLHQLQ